MPPIGHLRGRVVVVDRVEKQIGGAPFSPRAAVPHFARLLGDYGVAKVTGDSFAGNTFKVDFAEQRIGYDVAPPKSNLYEALEPILNAREIELLDLPTLVEQTVCLVWRGQRIDHETGAHDDWANAVAGLAHVLCSASKVAMVGPIICYSPVGSLFDAPVVDGNFMSDYAISELQRLQSGDKPW